MSDLHRLMAAAEKDPTLSEKLSMLDAEALVEWAQEEGYHLTLEEAESVCGTELSDEDLGQVAGGWTGNQNGP